jgi:hypothetical protein
MVTNTVAYQFIKSYMSCFIMTKAILHEKNRRRVAGCLLAKVMADHISRLGYNTDARNVIRIKGGLNFVSIFRHNYAMSL